MALLPILVIAGLALNPLNWQMTNPYLLNKWQLLSLIERQMTTLLGDKFTSLVEEQMTTPYLETHGNPFLRDKWLSLIETQLSTPYVNPFLRDKWPSPFENANSLPAR